MHHFDSSLGCGVWYVLYGMVSVFYCLCMYSHNSVAKLTHCSVMGLELTCSIDVVYVFINVSKE